jgi:hypothetical protein
VPRSIFEGATTWRAIARTEAYDLSHRQRKKVEMLFAHQSAIWSRSDKARRARLGWA